MLTNMTSQSTNQMNSFFHGSMPVGKIGQISYVCLLEKNFGKPQMNSETHNSRTVLHAQDWWMTMNCVMWTIPQGELLSGHLARNALHCWTTMDMYFHYMWLLILIDWLVLTWLDCHCLLTGIKMNSLAQTFVLNCSRTVTKASSCELLWAYWSVRLAHIARILNYSLLLMQNWSE